MKKAISISLIFILILISSASTFAVSATLSAVTDTTKISPGSTFTISLHVSNLSDSTDTAIVRMSYDSSVIELVSYASGSGWSEMVEDESINLSYTPSASDLEEWDNPTENDQFVSFVVMRNSSSSADQDIAQLTFKLSENATIGSSTEINFPYVNLAVGGDDFEGSASITLSIVESTGTTDDGGSTGDDGNTGDTGSGDTGDSGDTGSTDSGDSSGSDNTDNSGSTGSTDTGNTTTDGSGTSNSSDNSTVRDSSLPQTGEEKAMFFVILGTVLTISGIFLFNYIKLKEIK